MKVTYALSIDRDALITIIIRNYFKFAKVDPNTATVEFCKDESVVVEWDEEVEDETQRR